MTAPIDDEDFDDIVPVPPALSPLCRLALAVALVLLGLALLVILATTEVSDVPPVTGPTVVTPAPYGPPPW